MARSSNIVTATDRTSILEYVSNLSESVAKIIKNDIQDNSGNRLSQKYCSGKTHTANNPIYTE